MGDLRNWFYALALLMAMLWGIAYFGFHNGGIAHPLLLISLIAWLYGLLIQKEKSNS